METTKLLLNKISFTQLTILTFLSSPFFFFKDYEIFSAILISAVASFIFIQLIKISTHNKFFVLFGFPVRLLLIAPPSALLVHKLHSNLIALFIGFVISQVIYFIFVYSYAKKRI